MLETLLIVGAASLLEPLLRRRCENNEEEHNEETTTYTDASCDHEYGTDRASGERQTTLSEFGF